MLASSAPTALEASAFGIACALLTALVVRLLWPVLTRYALARPNARSSHRVPTPQGGGMAVAVVATTATIIALVVKPVMGHGVSPWAVLAMGLVLSAVGAIDDIVQLRASPRLFCQLGAAVVTVVGLPDDLRVLPGPHLLEQVLLVLALVWFINLVNFMDGIDWITVVEVIPICVGVCVLALMDAAPPIAFVLGIALGGSVMGFAPFNRPVARLFLGDVGSLPIGLWLGWLLILVAASGHLVAAVLLPLYYLADATVTLGRRLVRRERVWEAHRTHFYQRATDNGFTVAEIDARIFSVNVVLLALGIASARWIHVGVQIGTVSTGMLIVGWLMFRFHRKRR